MGIKPNTELTSTERFALEKFHAFLEKHQTPPSVRKLGAMLGISHGAAHNIIKSLRKKGHLTEGRVTVTRLKLSAKGMREI